MRTLDLTVPAVDDLPLRGYSWLPDADAELHGAVLLVHGMAEHCGRYARFAEQLTEAGYAVYGYDQRGHGRTATASGEPLGHFADSGGWQLILGDLHTMREHVRDQHPRLPLFVFAHSMGSLLARNYLQHHGEGLAGVVLCGTGGDPGPLRLAGLGLAKLEALVRGRRTTSPTLNKLIFGSHNKQFLTAGKARTDFEWLSRDADEVDKYVADPWCGFLCTTQFYADLLEGVAAIHDPRRVKDVPKDVPLFLIAGALDPVGESWKGVLKAKAQFEEAGVHDVRAEVYPEARHEILNDDCRDQVTDDVLAWMDEHASSWRA